MNKRGISAVVATVLIILLVVSGVGIVWLGIMPMINDISIDKSAGLRLVSNEGHTLWDRDSRLATVQVERAANGPDIYGIDIVFSFSGNSVTHFVEDVPGLNGKRVYYVNLSEYSGDLDSIKIVPIFWGGIAGGVASELKIEKIPEVDIVEMIEDKVIAAEEFVEPTGYSGGGSGSSSNNGGSPSGGNDAETSTCNNNIIESGETCDGAALNSETCLSRGFDSGDLTCLVDCSGYNFSGCNNADSVCGDGVCNSSENCASCEGDCGVCGGGEFSVSGWFEPVPTTYDISDYELTNLEQPGSRIFYISNLTGNDLTASIYFWNGSHIVDELESATGAGGVLYGTDPMNPTGPIMPFKRWAYVAPRMAGTGGLEIGTSWNGDGWWAPGYRESFTRYEHPDWWLFKRGETFDLHEDYLSFAQETNSSVQSIGYGGGFSLPGGRNETQMQILGAYGPLEDDRPKMINPPGPFIYMDEELPVNKHIAYLSIHFSDGNHFWSPSMPSETENILYEDCLLEGFNAGGAFQGDMKITFHRCIFRDIYSNGGMVTALFYAGGDSGVGKLIINESIFMRNGFNAGDPRDDGDSWDKMSEDGYSILDRNMYLSGHTQSMVSGLYDSVSMLGGSGDQMRPGMRVEGNYFYQGYVAMGAYGGYPDAYGPTGTYLDNVNQIFDSYGTNNEIAHPGYGFSLFIGANEVDVARNIIFGTEDHPMTEHAFFFDSCWLYDSGITCDYPVRNNRVFDNIIKTQGSSTFAWLREGVERDRDNFSTSGYVFPGLVNNSFYDNVMITQSLNDYWYHEMDYANGTSINGTTTDTAFIDNRVYGTLGEAVSAEGWTDADRSLKTYMESLGVTVTSEDGFMEYYNEVADMRKGTWREELMARAIVNHIREGYGMALLG